MTGDVGETKRNLLLNGKSCLNDHTVHSLMTYISHCLKSILLLTNSHFKIMSTLSKKFLTFQDVFLSKVFTLNPQFKLTLNFLTLSKNILYPFLKPSRLSKK